MELSIDQHRPPLSTDFRVLTGHSAGVGRAWGRELGWEMKLHTSLEYGDCLGSSYFTGTFGLLSKRYTEAVRGPSQSSLGIEKSAEFSDVVSPRLQCIVLTVAGFVNFPSGPGWLSTFCVLHRHLGDIEEDLPRGCYHQTSNHVDQLPVCVGGTGCHTKPRVHWTEDIEKKWDMAWPLPSVSQSWAEGMTPVKWGDSSVVLFVLALAIKPVTCACKLTALSISYTSSHLCTFKSVCVCVLLVSAHVKIRGQLWVSVFSQVPGIKLRWSGWWQVPFLAEPSQPALCSFYFDTGPSKDTGLVLCTFWLALDLIILPQPPK